jgi:hypothetical protein
MASESEVKEYMAIIAWSERAQGNVHTHAWWRGIEACAHMTPSLAKTNEQLLDAMAAADGTDVATFRARMEREAFVESEFVELTKRIDVGEEAFEELIESLNESVEECDYNPVTDEPKLRRQKEWFETGFEHGKRWAYLQALMMVQSLPESDKRFPRD